LPRTVEVAVSLAEVRDRLLKGLQVAPERDDAFYQQHGYRSGSYLYQDSKSQSGGGLTYVSAESKRTAVFGKWFYADAKNSESLFVHAYGEAVVSSYYFVDRGPLGYSATYAIALTARDATHTAIAISSMNSTVYVGREFSLHAFGYVPKALPVAPSPSEEYRLLVYAGHLVGAELTTLEEKRPSKT
jgi:hypothetical protein